MLAGGTSESAIEHALTHLGATRAVLVVSCWVRKHRQPVPQFIDDDGSVWAYGVPPSQDPHRRECLSLHYVSHEDSRHEMAPIKRSGAALRNSVSSRSLAKDWRFPATSPTRCAAPSADTA